MSTPAYGHPHGPYTPGSLYARMGMPPWAPLAFFTLPGFAVLTTVSILVGLVVSLIAGVGISEIAESGGVPTSPEGLWVLKFMQGLSQLFGMALLAVLLAMGTSHATHELGLVTPAISPRVWGVGLLIVVLGIPALQAFVIPREWIAQWGSFGTWSLDQETKIESLLTKFLQDDLLLNLIIIALIPAIAEELLFRGWIQGSLARVLNVHAAIWITAVIFSAIHLQAMGFVVRVLLGAGLGYMRWRSGSLWPAILGHFVNNALAILAAYAALNGQAPKEILQTDFRLPIGITLGAVALWAAAWWLYVRLTPQADQPQQPAPLAPANPA